MYLVNLQFGETTLFVAEIKGWVKKVDSGQVSWCFVNKASADSIRSPNTPGSWLYKGRSSGKWI